ncbi:TonB-dependent receptor [Salegentibacter sp. JZCK2]|uniref:SusC/RagA family TonB-linked outer membrane protein n=1 Tax=Salegentibacter tibetensis TaxID=2873600 RepID=UPI001CCE2412|nr:TonB-dependent receptor [Salegentibacter tibetensis]MBZ9730076.1 TonB-dependent receptor [Salegentibacter tibetensis]
MNMKISTSPSWFCRGKRKSIFLCICITALVLTAGNTNVFASNAIEITDQETVAGMVTDQIGMPLPGVNVFVKGTTVGTQTDFDGNYSLEVAEGQTLVFSYVGYETKEIVVGQQRQIDVTLPEDASQLDEIVVLGYTAQTRGDLTGAVSSVDVSEATKAPIVNAAEALEGRVTGVTVQNNGAPGGSPVVRIRGFGTSNNNNPLYIIDGVQTDDPSILNNLNPNDIEQMNVLKDGAAAIYGARASNGVVIITTKGGGYNMSKPTISIDSYTGFSRASNLPGLLNPQQHGEMIFQSLRNDGVEVSHPQYGSGAEPVVPSMLQGISVDATVPPGGTDWLDEIFQTAPTHSASVSLQNGNEYGKYLMSLNYLKREGIQLATGFERASTRLNSEFKIKDNLRVGEHLNVSFSNTRGGNQVNNALRSSPLVPVRADNGEFAGTYVASAGLSNPPNPVAELLRGSDNFNKSLRIFGDVYAVLDVMDGLSVKTSIAADIQSFNSRSFLPVNPEHSEPRSTNTLTENDFNNYEWIWTNTVNYNKNFGDHSINAVAGVEALYQQGKGKGISRNGYLFENPDFYLLSNGSSPAIVNFAYDQTSTLYSLFGTANYNYLGKYLFTATLRRDKSSRFRGDNQSDIFPSFSAGWVISDEEFFPDGGVVNRLKLKASYGELGNQTLPAANPTINISRLDEQFANYAFNGSGAITNGAVLSQVGNPNLKWETSVSKNIGFNLGMFGDKLDVSVEAYEIVTKDLITRDNSLISTTAIDATAPLVNLGSIKNTGVDFSLGYQSTATRDFTYGFNFNLSHYRNEVTELISDFQTGSSAYRGGAITRTEVGRPLSSFYGREVIGIFASEAEVSAAADQGFGSPADGVGRFQYADINNDGVINDEDRTYIGSPHPDFTYGLNLNAGYKGFDVSIFFAGSQGNDIYNYQKIFTDFPTFFNGNRSVRVQNSFTPDNTNAALPALSQTIRNGETTPNSYFVEDGSYLRLRNLQIGYNFAEGIVERLRVQDLRLFVQGTNLFTITGYDGLDPEIASFDSLTLGVDGNIAPVYPISQLFTLGVNIKL